MNFYHTQLTQIKGTTYGGDSIWKVPGFTQSSIKAAVKQIVAILEEAGFDVEAPSATTGSTYVEAYMAEGDRVVEIRVSDHFKRDEYSLVNKKDAFGSVQLKEFSDGIVKDEEDHFQATVVSQEAKKEVIEALKLWV